MRRCMVTATLLAAMLLGGCSRQVSRSAETDVTQYAASVRMAKVSDSLIYCSGRLVIIDKPALVLSGEDSAECRFKAEQIMVVDEMTLQRIAEVKEQLRDSVMISERMSKKETADNDVAGRVRVMPWLILVLVLVAVAMEWSRRRF